jgi:hypothetical protein
MVATLLFALAPALQATRVELVHAMRGEVVPDYRPGRVRGALVGLQVTSSVLLLVSAAIFLRSSWAAANVDPGIRTADTVNVNVMNEQRRRAILDVIASEPSVVSMAATWPGLGGRPALADGASGTSMVRYQFVSPEYFGAIGVDLVRGRGFTQDERSTGAAVAIVSERVARDLWPGLEALGQRLRLEPSPGSELQPNDPPLPSQTLIVVGVARDVAGFRLGGLRMGGAGVYVPTAAEAAGTSLMLRARDDSERARHALVDRFAAVDPDMAEVSTLKMLARMEAYFLGIPFWLTLVLGALALVLTLSGLVSVLSYLVERHTREIGVRMALGATRVQVTALVLTQLALPVGIGVVLGGSLTAAIGALLLTTSAAEQIGSSVRLFDPVAYAGSLLCIITACVGAALVPALRAGRIDPVGALRRD